MNQVVTGLWSIFGFSLIVMTLIDGFSFINLSRKTEQHTSVSRLMERYYWRILRFFYARTSSVRVREKLLSLYAPVLLISLLVLWLVSLILGFAILSWAMGEGLRGTSKSPHFLDYVYFSGVTFFTLGYGDFSPVGSFGKIYSLIEVFCGYSFLGLMIGFTPTFNSVFYERELGLVRIQTRISFSFSASSVIYKMIPSRDIHFAHEFFRESSQWFLKLFLSQLCYPILCYHRSPSRRGTWLSGVAVLMDLAAMCLAWLDVDDNRSGRNLHVTGVEELKLFCQLFDLKPDLNKSQTRVTRADAMQIWDYLKKSGFPVKQVDDPYEELCGYLNDYSAYLDTLAEYLLMKVPTISMNEADRGGGMAYSSLF